ncbi:MAG: ATP-binding cassette domain-containing protein [Hyphomicrobiaceae bacterium]
MAAPLVALSGIGLTFGGTPLIESAELTVMEGDRLCLVGRNGSGKSTLLRIVAGLIEPDRGERVLRSDVGVRYLPQEPDLDGFDTVLTYAEAGLGPADDPYRAASLLNALGLSGEEAPGSLSGGELRRAALARVLAPEPDVLLLDEPTNHLDLPAIEWLEAELKTMRSALVLISHDRRFLDRLSTATLWLDRGRVRRLDKGFAAFEGWRDETIAQEELEAHKLERRIARETEWLHYGGVTARRRRNEGRKRKLEAMRQSQRDRRRVQGDVRITVTEGETSGKLVIEAEGIAKAFGARSIVEGLSIRIARGDRLGIVGANGAGKTTILRMLTGDLSPDSGSIRLGANLQMVTLEQSRQSLRPETPLAEVLTGGRGDTVTVGGEKRHVVSYMKDFLFAPEQARTPVGRLSGGERGRLMLAAALSRPSNLLVLDEPTNDLDLETLDLLEEMIADYPGTVVLVSHDRDFLDRTVTSMLMSEGEGRWTEYAGGYSDMLAQRGRGVEARKTGRPSRKVVEEMPAGASAGRSAVSPLAEAPKRKLSFKEKHALETLPARIAALEAEIAGLDGRLADQGLFARDATEYGRIAERVAKARTELSGLEDRWLELEVLRESLEG